MSQDALDKILGTASVTYICQNAFNRGKGAAKKYEWKPLSTFPH